MLRLSIIIPVYNVENFLRRCVESVENQDIPQADYEVILVNDGSTDQSGEICSALAGEYANIKLISKENGGLSSARNAGLDVANGEYVMFVDSDDYIYPDVLKYLLDCCKTNDLDVCHFYYNVADGNDKTTRAESPFGYDKVLSGEEVFNCYMIGSACANIVKLSVLREHDLQFYVGIIHEDVEFMTRLLCYVKRLMVVDKDVYHYTLNPNSLWRAKRPEKMKQELLDSLKVSKLQQQFALTHEEINSFFRNKILHIVSTDVCCSLMNVLRDKRIDKTFCKEYVRILKGYCLYPIRLNYLETKFRLITFFLNKDFVLSVLIRFLKNKDLSKCKTI